LGNLYPDQQHYFEIFYAAFWGCFLYFAEPASWFQLPNKPRADNLDIRKSRLPLLHRTDRSVAVVHVEPAQAGGGKCRAEDDHHVGRVGPVGRTEDAGPAGDRRELRGNGRAGRGPA